MISTYIYKLVPLTKYHPSPPRSISWLSRHEPRAAGYFVRQKLHTNVIHQLRTELKDKEAVQTLSLQDAMLLSALIDCLVAMMGSDETVCPSFMDKF
jgi:hypothetical protein